MASGPQALAFLKALDFHQSREWFAENKALYVSELEKPRADLWRRSPTPLRPTGLRCAADRKKSVYRIYRDIDFQTTSGRLNRHVSALLTPSGEKRERKARSSSRSASRAASWRQDSTSTARTG